MESWHSKVIELKGQWYLHIPVTKAVECFQKEQVRHVVGIDRGLRFLTVSYDEQGKTEFISRRKNCGQTAQVSQSQTAAPIQRHKICKAQTQSPFRTREPLDVRCKSSDF